MVHPHGRGELATNLSCKLDTLGSSPRTWGTPSITVTQLCNGRFIPTDVGNSSPASRISSIPSVHPHGRGELIVPQSEHTIPSGSSPRTWGTREFIQHQAGNRRFIPTDVGNSYTTDEQGSEEPVHPHGRGELKDVVCGEWQYYGSSPRTWGTHRICGDSERSGRFIPTDVGNSLCVGVKGGILLVHPHGRGELVRSQSPPGSGVGSSPRTWGTLTSKNQKPQCCWFIPTDVGNSFREPPAPGANTVHPHGRGELSTIQILRKKDIY